MFETSPALHYVHHFTVIEEKKNNNLDSILWDVKNIKKTIFRDSFLFMFKWSAKYERKFCVFLHIMYIHETLSGILNKNLPINSWKRANLLSQ